MKKLLISSANFEGEVILVYMDGKLAIANYTEAEISEKQIRYLQDKTPINYVSEEQLHSIYKANDLTIIESDFTVSFQDWWTLYKKKINKDRALKIWNKLSQSDQAKVFFNTRKYNRYLQLNQWREKADPDTYLRNRMYLNEWK